VSASSGQHQVPARQVPDLDSPDLDGSPPPVATTCRRAEVDREQPEKHIAARTLGSPIGIVGIGRDVPDGHDIHSCQPRLLPSGLNRSDGLMSSCPPRRGQLLPEGTS